jgi:hypothetical protein
MMNMMNRFVEGRGHQREIDMLLELTCVQVALSPVISSLITTHPIIVNKLRAAPSAHWVTQLHGPSRV